MAAELGTLRPGVFGEGNLKTEWLEKDLPDIDKWSRFDITADLLYASHQSVKIPSTSCGNVTTRSLVKLPLAERWPLIYCELSVRSRLDKQDDSPLSWIGKSDFESKGIPRDISLFLVDPWKVTMTLILDVISEGHYIWLIKRHDLWEYNQILYYPDESSRILTTIRNSIC